MLYIITVAFYFPSLNVVDGKCYSGPVAWAPNMYQHVYSAVPLDFFCDHLLDFNSIILSYLTVLDAHPPVLETNAT